MLGCTHVIYEHAVMRVRRIVQQEREISLTLMIPNVGFQTGCVSLQVDTLKITLLRDLKTLKIDSVFIFLLLAISK